MLDAADEACGSAGGRGRSEFGAWSGNAPRIEPCSLNDVSANMLALMQPEIRIRKARVVTRLAPELLKVSGDTVLLEQVLLNLILRPDQPDPGDPAN